MDKKKLEEKLDIFSEVAAELLEELAEEENDRHHAVSVLVEKVDTIFNIVIAKVRDDWESELYETVYATVDGLVMDMNVDIVFSGVSLNWNSIKIAFGRYIGCTDEKKCDELYVKLKDLLK